MSFKCKLRVLATPKSWFIKLFSAGREAFWKNGMLSNEKKNQGFWETNYQGKLTDSIENNSLKTHRIKHGIDLWLLWPK